MGGSQSTRKITISNESAHIIKVSDSVIERLKNVDNGKSSTTSQVPPPRPTVNVSNQQSPISAAPAVAYAGSLTSLQVLQEKEKQLKENDQYWANRVKDLEDTRRSITELMKDEFVTTVHSLEERIPKRQLKLSSAPCEDKKQKVVECYRSNPKQILLCSKEVADFANCVDLKRLTAA